MSDAFLQTLYQQFLATQDPQLAIQFMQHYMRETGIQPSSPKPRQLPAQIWIKLAQEQGWNESERIVELIENYPMQKFDFIYGYQCPCKQVFLHSAISELIPNIDPKFFGKSCEFCDEVYTCGKCNLLIKYQMNYPQAENLHYLCQNCLARVLVEAFKTGALIFDFDIAESDEEAGIRLRPEGARALARRRFIVEFDEFGTPIRLLVNRALHHGINQIVEILGFTPDPTQVRYRRYDGRISAAHYAWFESLPEGPTLLGPV